MKHIIVFSLAYFPLVGGAEIALREITKRLSKKYHFTIITAKLQKGLPREETIDGIRVIRVGTGNAFFDKLCYIRLATREAEKLSPDLIFALLENQTALAAQKYHKKHGTPILINLQSGDTEEYIYRKLRPFGFLYDRVYNPKHRYVVLSHYLKERALRHGIPEQNITLIPNGVDLSLFDPKKYPAKEITALRKKLNLHGTVLITASRLTHKNAVDDIICALALLPFDATLIICGIGEDEGKLRALADKLGVASKIRWLGLIPYNELPRYILASDIFIRPSLSEGFGNSFIEALAMGKPIIATNVGGIPDFLTDKKTGLFCAACDPRDLAQKIKQITTDKKLARAIAKNGQILVRKKYSWDTIASAFDKLFGELL